MSPPVDPPKLSSIERAMAYQVQRQRDLVQILGDSYASDPSMTPLLALILERMYAYRLVYLQRGDGQKAHGAARMIQILWHTFVAETRAPKADFSPTLPAGLDSL